MTIGVTRLTPCFAAGIDDVDITRPVDEATWAEIRAAFEEHPVALMPKVSPHGRWVTGASPAARGTIA